MAISSTMLAADFAVMVADWGTTVTVQSNSACSALVQDLTISDDLMPAGYEGQAAVEVNVLSADVTKSVPAPGGTVTIGSTTYRIVSVLSAQGDVVKRLLCEERMA